MCFTLPIPLLFVFYHMYLLTNCMLTHGVEFITTTSICESLLKVIILCFVFIVYKSGFHPPPKNHFTIHFFIEIIFVNYLKKYSDVHLIVDQPTPKKQKFAAWRGIIIAGTHAKSITTQAPTFNNHPSPSTPYSLWSYILEG